MAHMSTLVSELLAELSTFQAREEQLRRIYRWRNRRPMFYRPHLFSHSKKVAWLVGTVLPSVRTILKNFDEKRAFALALVHDDAEILTGDYQAGDKANMSREQLSVLDKEEREAVQVLAAKFPKIVGGYDYKELLFDILDLTTPEAWVAKYLDRFDAFGEGLHEIYAGNIGFTQTLHTEFGETPRFTDLNVSLREKMMEKYPGLQSLKNSHVFFEPSVFLDWNTIVPTRSPYTQESLEEPVGYLQYDEWKKVILNSGDSEEIKNLYTQQEFL